MEAATKAEIAGQARARGLLVRQVALPRRDPRGDGLPVAGAGPGRAGEDPGAQRGRCARSAPAWITRQMEEKRWIGDDIVRQLGEAGLCGLYVPEEYGGQGLSQTGYCRVFETFAQIDGTLSVVMGVHQSIGMKGIVLFGSDEQKERFLPDLASGPQARRLRADRARGRARTPTTSSRARSSSPTAPGCSTARSATSATAARATSSSPSPAARSTARTATSR